MVIGKPARLLREAIVSSESDRKCKTWPLLVSHLSTNTSHTSVQFTYNPSDVYKATVKAETKLQAESFDGWETRLSLCVPVSLTAQQVIRRQLRLSLHLSMHNKCRLSQLGVAFDFLWNILLLLHQGLSDAFYGSLGTTVIVNAETKLNRLLVEKIDFHYAFLSDWQHTK